MEVARLFRTLLNEVEAFRSQLSSVTGPGPKPSVINHVWLWITQWKPHSRVNFAVRIWGVNYCCASQPLRNMAEFRQKEEYELRVATIYNSQPKLKFTRAIPTFSDHIHTTPGGRRRPYLLATYLPVPCREGYYPQPSPSTTSTWHASYSNFQFYRGKLESGQGPPADDVEAHCLWQLWHKDLLHSTRQDEGVPSPRERVLAAITQIMREENINHDMFAPTRHLQCSHYHISTSGEHAGQWEEYAFHIST